jgi:hypothetical protein
MQVSAASGVTLDVLVTCPVVVRKNSIRLLA